jgi:hypothetical protein
MANETIAKVKIPKFVVVDGVNWTPALIKERISTSDLAVKKALIRIWNWQTEDEKQTQSTNQTNGVGFNGIDAEILTSFAEQLDKKGWLSPKQIAIARKKLMKYSNQIYVHHLVAQRVELHQKFGL